MRDNIAYNFPPCLYYGQVLGMDQVRINKGFSEYRWNESVNERDHGYGDYGEFYWADDTGFQVLTDADVSPLSPDVDPADTDFLRRSVRGVLLPRFHRYELHRRSYWRAEGYSTPAGKLHTHWKIISKNMTAVDEASGYSTPVVP